MDEKYIRFAKSAQEAWQRLQFKITSVRRVLNAAFRPRVAPCNSNPQLSTTKSLPTTSARSVSAAAKASAAALRDLADKSPSHPSTSPTSPTFWRRCDTLPHCASLRRFSAHGLNHPAIGLGLTFRPYERNYPSLLGLDFRFSPEFYRYSTSPSIRFRLTPMRPDPIDALFIPVK